MADREPPTCATCDTPLFWNIISQAWIHADRKLDTHPPAGPVEERKN